MDDDGLDFEMGELETDGLEPDDEIEGSDDQPSTEGALNLQDFEGNSGTIFVEVSFIQGDIPGVYSMIEVALELTWQTQETGHEDWLPHLKGDKSVILSFETFTQPGETN